MTFSNRWGRRSSSVCVCCFLCSSKSKFLLHLADCPIRRRQEVTRGGLWVCGGEADTKPGVIRVNAAAGAAQRSTTRCSGIQLTSPVPGEGPAAPAGRCRNPDPFRSRPHHWDSGTAGETRSRCSLLDGRASITGRQNQQRLRLGPADLICVGSTTGKQQSRFKQKRFLLTAGQINRN